MKRSEKVVKNIPADFTNPDKAERWLEENAEQGLVLIRYSGRKAVFIKGEPAKTAYMVVPMDPDGMKGPRDQGEEYKEFGWEYVTQLGRMVLILRGMPGKCERVQLLAGNTLFKKLRKKQRGRIWGLFSPFIFWLIWFLFFYFFQGYGFLLLFAKGVAWLIFLAMGVGGLLQMWSFREARVADGLLEGIRNRFGLENPSDGNRKNGAGTSVQKKRRGTGNPPGLLYRVLSIIFLISLVLGMAGGIHYGAGRVRSVYTGKVSEAGWDESDFRTKAFLDKYPSWKEISPVLLPLSRLEEQPEMEYQTLDYRGEKLENYSSINRFPFAPIQAETMQYGIWNSGDGTRESTLKLEYYRLASPKLASPLMRELGRYYMNWNKGWMPQRVASGSFDELVIHDRGLHYLFARKDNQVLMAYYIGEENLEDHLPELEEMMDMLSGK